MGHQNGQPCALEKSTTPGRARFATPEEIREIPRMISVGTQTQLLPNNKGKQRRDSKTNTSASTSTARPRVVSDEPPASASPARPLSTPTERGSVPPVTVSSSTEPVPPPSGENGSRITVHRPPEGRKERPSKRHRREEASSQQLCWNCRQEGHKYTVCPLAVIEKDSESSVVGVADVTPGSSHGSVAERSKLQYRYVP
ncbi:hypothetical protein KQX54_016275 [Cotesia glomerata]|uniref:Uncharacterized protein n=1 Tax=Cotesia glomerata TaxID=32391 RepID=A0AAV7J5C4_COTGL|nr:hypothetical protein KQX54_016275 [Cotesia glomerata]